MLTLKTSNLNIETERNIIATDNIVMTQMQDTSTHCEIKLITKVPLEDLIITYQDDSIKDKDKIVAGYINGEAYEAYYDEEDKIVLETPTIPAATLTITYYIKDSTNENIKTDYQSTGIGQAKNGDEVVNIYSTLYIGETAATNYILTQSFESIIPTKIKIKHQIPYDLTIMTNNNIYAIEEITEDTYILDTTKYDAITDIYIYKETQQPSDTYDQIMLEGIITTTTTDTIFQYAYVTANNTRCSKEYKYIAVSEDIRLDLNYEIIEEQEIYQKGDEILLKFTRNADYYIIDKPVFTILIPEQLEYIDSYLEYTSIVDEVKYLSTEKDYPKEKIEPILISNYKDTTLTAIRYTFTTQFPNSDSLTVAITLKIISNLTNLISFSGYLGNYQSTFYAAKTTSEMYTDILDLDDDLNTTERIVKTSDIILNIDAPDYEVTLKSIGNQDKDYTTTSTTSSGSNVNYLLTISNDNDTTLNDIEIINILPNINDTYNTSKISRHSEYQVYLVDEITAQIETIDSIKDTEINITYSELDPIRFDENNLTIGTNTWKETLPYTNIQSIKITKTTLAPYEQLNITIPAITSMDAKTLAYNTIAIKAQLNNTIIIKETELNATSINNQNFNIKGYIWLDDGDGIYKEESKLNNMNIYLLDEKQNILNKTITTPYLTENGYYNFDNLDTNNYYIKVDPDIYTFTKQDESKININTKLTDLINLNENQIINAGLIEINNPIINAQNKMLLLNDQYDPLENITAKDQFNNDITNKIIVIKNTVDSTTKGTYIVTYQVTDDYNISTIKTIYITVTDSKITLAKNDIIQSIALQQTGIAHILNAEGEKIQKIIQTKSTKDILKTNKSVINTIYSITTLEQMLKNKITLIK